MWKKAGIIILIIHHYILLYKSIAKSYQIKSKQSLTLKIDNTFGDSDKPKDSKFPSGTPIYYVQF